MKKTLISIFLVAFMLVSFIIPASAESGSLGAKTTFDGKTITVDLVVEGNPGIIAITAHADYDSNVLTLKSAKNGEIFESIFTPSQTLEENPYKIIWMDATASQDIKTNGVLATYTFEVKDDAAEQTEVKFSIAETVNVKNEDTTKFIPCTVKLDLKNMTSEAINESETTTSSSVATIGQSDDNDTNQDTTSNTAESENEIVEKTNNSTLIILSIAAVVVLGGIVTVVAIYARKKSANK